MYLKNLFIENMWSIEKLQILEKDLFLENWNLKPVILLWKNWSWKTTLLSCISDSFFELWNKVFNNILPKDWIWYKYYKASGGLNTKIWENYSFSYLQFKKDNDIYEYVDKNWELSFQECKEKTNNLLTLQNKWNEVWNTKISSEVKNNKNFKSDFWNNSYCIFPANRFEYPYWMIRDSYNKITNVKDSKKYNWDLWKSILVNDSMDDIKSWILDLFLDAKFRIKNNGKWGYDFDDVKNPQNIDILNQWIENIENLLSEILDKKVKLSVNYRWQWSRINIIDGCTNEIVLDGLDKLSAWESILICMFLTIIRYSDIWDINKSFKLNEIEWIVVIDEIDLHLHIRLQKEVLPRLIKLFPKVQFIISTHSPFFLYWMNKEFWDDTLMLNMPSWVILDNYDNFEEFQQAFNTFESLTENYKLKYEELSNSLNIENDIIICEGKTDVIHIKKAIEKLWIENLDNIQFIEIPNDWWDSELKKALKYIAMLSHTNKIIWIFDRDREDTIRDIGELKGYWNNVYAFCIPIPKWRDKYNKISIEFYYDDKDLHKEKNWQCLCFTNELNFDNDRKPLELRDKDKVMEDFNKQIFDENIWNVKWVHSKARFAELVKNDEDFIKDFNFENFRLIINKIKEILEKHD